MAKEYIEREAICYQLEKQESIDGQSRAIRRARRIVADFPAADVVPVVRCGECKWFQINMRQDGYLPKGVPECECRHWCGACDPTDFCSYGVRKDGDGE